MQASSKQLEYWREANHRWNVKQGATRSGKTYMDYFLLPRRLLAVKGKEGLSVILGNTRETIRRNIIIPLQTIYGAKRVGNIRADNSCMMFGESVFCLGADNANHVDRLRGASIKYCYGDEVTTWNAEVFDMLKSRLDKPYSLFDGTCNPDNPRHWFKAFLESDADIYCQTYTIDDNPFLDPVFVENLKKEYAGTVYYDRFILGQWSAAEGVIYRAFADNPRRFIIDDALVNQENEKRIPIMRAVIGVDFGGGTSAHAFSCVGFTQGYRQMIVLDEYREQEALTPDKLADAFVDFVRACKARWNVTECYCDSAEQTLINGLRTAAARERLAITIGNAIKKPINDRIRCLCLLMGADRFKVAERCKHTIDAIRSAVWDSRKLTEDVRLDDGKMNIDSLDAMEYAYEREMRTMVGRW